MNKSQEAQIRRCFTYQHLNQEERDMCELLVDRHRDLALFMAKVCPVCRESNLSLRCLEESLDWARKAVVRYPQESADHQAR
jgi:hypothetical protein